MTISECAYTILFDYYFHSAFPNWQTFCVGTKMQF